MPNYKRWRTGSRTRFFTVNLLNRRQTLLTDHIDRLRNAFRTVRRRHPFTIDAIVVLPDHVHCIMTLPDGDNDYATRWSLIKAHFSRYIPANERKSKSRTKRNERGIWQRRFWEHVITDQNDLNRHVDYIHFNPVRHKHCTRPVDWPYSSIHHYIRRGVLRPTWGTNTPPDDIDLD